MAKRDETRPVFLLVEAMGGRFALEVAPGDLAAVLRHLQAPFGPSWREITEREAARYISTTGREWIKSIARGEVAL